MKKIYNLCVFMLAVLLTACPAPATPSTAPAAPKTVEATVQGSSVLLTWEYAATADSFEVYREESSAALKTTAFTKLADVDGSQKTYQDDTVEVTKSYRYAVTAVKAKLRSEQAVQTNTAVTIPNDSQQPTANEDAYTLKAGETLSVSVADGVLKNDLGDALTAVKVADPNAGTLTLNADGSFSYSNTNSSATSDSFSYKAISGELESAVTTVNLTISSVNRAPVASDVSYDLIVNTPLFVATPFSGLAAVKDAEGLTTKAASDADNDTLTVTTGALSAASGTLSTNADGSFIFTPNRNFIGSVSFDYTVTDTSSETATANVTLNVLDAQGSTTGTAKLYYADASATAGGDGTAVNPFNNVTNFGAEGDTLFIAAGTYNATGDYNIFMKAEQSLIGQGVGLEIAELELVPAGDNPVLTGATDTSIELDNIANGVTIKGLTIDAPARHGIHGKDELSGTIIMDDLIIQNTGKLGINIEENKAAGTGQKHDLFIRNVKIINPGTIGIQSNDARTLTMDNVEVTGVKYDLTDGFSGRGIQLETEFTTTMNVSNTTVSFGPVASDKLLGFRIFKNNGYTNRSNPDASLILTTLTLNLNNVNVINEGTKVGTAFRIFALTTDPEDSNYEGPDVGSFNVTGANNTAATSQFDNAVIFEPAETTCSSSLRINGVSLVCPVN